MVTYHEADVSTSKLETAWFDTTGWDQPRDLDHLPDFLEHFSSSSKDRKGLTWAPETKGAPHTIVITGAGLRAADLSRCVISDQSLAEPDSHK